MNQNILAVLRTFSKLKKKKKKRKEKNFTPRRQLPKLQLLNFLKFLTERKYLMKTLAFSRRKHKHL